MPPTPPESESSSSYEEESSSSYEEESSDGVAPFPDRNQVTIPQGQNHSDEEWGESSEDKQSPSASNPTLTPTPTPKKSNPGSSSKCETSKRPGQTHPFTSNKKAKLSGKGKSSGGPVARVCTEEDELIILRGLIHSQEENGGDSIDMGAFYEIIKGKLEANMTRTQLYEKVRRMKQKYLNTVEKGQELAGESFDLSGRIWGGGLNLSVVKQRRSGKRNSTRKNQKNEDEDQEIEKVEKVEKAEEVEDADGGDFRKKYPAIAQAFAGLITTEQVNVINANLGAVRSDILKGFEERLQLMECELLLKKVHMLADLIKEVFDAMKKK